MSDDDIAKRAAQHVAALNGHSDEWERFMDEARDYMCFAADEIEHLRADIAKLETAHGQLQMVIDGLTAELAVAQRRADYLSKDFDRDIKLYQAELAAERDRANKLADDMNGLINNHYADAAKIAKLREALEMARDGLNNGGFISDKNRAAIDAVLEETSDE